MRFWISTNPIAACAGPGVCGKRDPKAVGQTRIGPPDHGSGALVGVECKRAAAMLDGGEVEEAPG